MSDPLDTPPVDHGGDRQDYVEIQAPDGVNPSGQWWNRLADTPCMHCLANVFARWLGPDPAQYRLADVHYAHPANWDVTIAHDDDCSTLLDHDLAR